MKLKKKHWKKNKITQKKKEQYKEWGPKLNKKNEKQCWKKNYKKDKKKSN